MSGHNTEIAIELGRLSDADDFGKMRDLMHPEIVLWAPQGWPERGPFRGREAVVRQFGRLAEDYSERRTDVDGIVASGDRLVGRLQWHVRATHSGIESDLEVWFASQYRDGLLVEIRYFWSRDEALQAAGIKG